MQFINTSHPAFNDILKSIYLTAVSLKQVSHSSRRANAQSNVITSFSTLSNVSNMIKHSCITSYSWPERRKQRQRLCHNKSSAAREACVAQSLQRLRSAPTTLGPALLHTTVTLIISSMNMISSRVLSWLFPPAVEVKTTAASEIEYYFTI